MLSQILPPKVIVVTMRGDIDAQLFPEEEWVVRNALESRRAEFATARACARQALSRLGLPSQAIPAGPTGDPDWPIGIVGSITHCDRYRAAAVARETEFTAIGIDAEPNRPLPDGVLDIVASPKEHEWVSRHTQDIPMLCWDRLLFCIKEAAYKAWFLLGSHSLGFEDADVAVDPVTASFVARPRSGVLDGGTRPSLFGRWHSKGDLILTAVAHPAS